MALLVVKLQSLQKYQYKKIRSKRFLPEMLNRKHCYPVHAVPRDIEWSKQEDINLHGNENFDMRKTMCAWDICIKLDSAFRSRNYLSFFEKR